MTEKRIAVLPVVDSGSLKKKGKHKINGQSSMVCLVTARTSGEWILPTGKYENHLSNQQVAELEAFEEAGLLGRIDETFCEVLKVKKTSTKGQRKIRLYRMWVTDISDYWPEKKQRKRAVVSYNKLSKHIKDKKLAKRLSKLACT